MSSLSSSSGFSISSELFTESPARIHDSMLLLTMMTCDCNPWLSSCLILLASLFIRVVVSLPLYGGL